MGEDEVFDVDADSSAFFAEEVKSCESDDAFAKKMDKFKKLMPEKTKDFKKKKHKRHRNRSRNMNRS